MKKSESIAHIATALVAFQADLPPISKNSTVKVSTKTGGSYSFAYATLDHILEVSRPALKKHGLAFSQFVSDGGITTILMHESGEWLEDFASFQGITYKSAQELGSAITYLRRYALTAALGISADEDDDGNVNAGNAYQRSARNGSHPARSDGRPKTSGPKSVVAEIFEAADKLWGKDVSKDELKKVCNGRMVTDLSPIKQVDLLNHIKSLMGEAETA